jgi:hypothetical protein
VRKHDPGMRGAWVGGSKKASEGGEKREPGGGWRLARWRRERGRNGGCDVEPTRCTADENWVVVCVEDELQRVLDEFIGQGAPSWVCKPGIGSEGTAQNEEWGLAHWQLRGPLIPTRLPALQTKVV